MPVIQYHRITPEDTEILNQISQWYLSEWKMDSPKTIARLSKLPATGIPFHLLMTLDGKPIATGGVAKDSSIIIDEPRLNIYQPWLSLVYTTPENQNKGYGTLLCQQLENMAKELGVTEYYLFTYTAEKMYLKLGWQVMERFVARSKNMVIMKKNLL